MALLNAHTFYINACMMHTFLHSFMLTYAWRIRIQFILTYAWRMRICSKLTYAHTFYINPCAFVRHVLMVRGIYSNASHSIQNHSIFVFQILSFRLSQVEVEQTIKTTRYIGLWIFFGNNILEQYSFFWGNFHQMNITGFNIYLWLKWY